MIEVIKFSKEEKYINDFIKLYYNLYNKDENCQNDKELENILNEKHILSKYFSIKKYLVYFKNEVVARCIITKYKDDNFAYFGFFESKNNNKFIFELFKTIEQDLKKENIFELIGPVNCSFWIGYRLKINNFISPPYFSEPYNKEYYYDLLKFVGFDVYENYISNIYNKVSLLNFKEEKYSTRRKLFKDKGYKIYSPTKKEYSTIIKEIYKIITERYSDFPVYKNISEKDFIEHYSFFKYILDFSFIKIAKKDNKVVGFFLGIPDYKNMFYKKIDFFSYLKIFFMKIRSSNYVMLYMGVNEEDRGLGKAITMSIIDEVKIRRSTAIGAFIKVGKETEKYVSSHINQTYNYVLLKKNFEVN